MVPKRLIIGLAAAAVVAATAQFGVVVIEGDAETPDGPESSG
jgi:hypothetical protein